MTPEEIIPPVRQWLQRQLALHPEIQAEFSAVLYLRETEGR